MEYWEQMNINQVSEWIRSETQGQTIVIPASHILKYPWVTQGLIASSCEGNRHHTKVLSVSLYLQ